MHLLSELGNINFVLTRKGLHYYVREKGATDLNGRDLFGLHEGSIAIRSMSQVDVSGDDDHRPLVFTIKTKGLGRDYTLRARSPATRLPHASTAILAPPALLARR